MAATVVKATFAAFEDTPATIKFREVLDESDPLATSAMGTIYVPKRTLKDSGWKGERLNIAITLGERVA